MSENAIIVVEVSIPREVIEHRFRDELSPLVPLLWREARAALLELEERAHAQEGLARRRILRRDGRFPELSTRVTLIGSSR